MSARLALWRWAWRMLRTGWRDQALVIGLITVAVAVSVAGSTLLNNALPSDLAIESQNRFSLSSDVPGAAEEVATRFGDDAGRFSSGLATPTGSTQQVDLRTFDPDHPRTSALLGLVSGRLPSGPAEVATTEPTATFLGGTIGDTVELDGVRVTIVGLVENPTDLSDEFVYLDVADPAPFVLVDEYLTGESVDPLIGRVVGNDSLPVSVSANETVPDRVFGRFVASVVTTLALVLVGLIVSASFSVLARRRIRQYGLLGALGANERHLRGVAAFNGFAVGVLAAIAGVVLGLIATTLALPVFEGAIGHRASLEVPMTAWLLPVVVAIVMSTVAAWWPARAMARQPIVEALAARRPERRPVRNTTVVGLVATVAGYLLLGYAAREQALLPAVIGVVLTIAGVLLLTPAAISLIGSLAGRTNLPVRIAGRDLARYQGRAAAALGAIVIASAIPVGVGVVTASLDARAENALPNLGDDTAIIWAAGTAVEAGAGVYVPTDLDPATADESLASIAAALPSAHLVPIEVPVDTLRGSEVIDGIGGSSSVAGHTSIECGLGGNVSSFATSDEERCYRPQTMWIATPEVRELLGIDPASNAAFFTSVEEPIFWWVDSMDAEGARFPREVAAEQVAPPDVSAFPAHLISEDELGGELQRAVVGWVVTSPSAFTPEDISTIRAAMTNGTTVELLTEPTGTNTARTVAALVGMLVGLAILGATVTLIRGEGADDARVLDVLGASSRVRRLVAGSTAALLAFAGVILAVPIGFLGIIIEAAGQPGPTPFAVPWSTLLILFVLFPFVACVATASLSGGGLKEIR